MEVVRRKRRIKLDMKKGSGFVSSLSLFTQSPLVLPFCRLVQRLVKG